MPYLLKDCLKTKVDWGEVKEGRVVWRGVSHPTWYLVMNDFPEEPLYSLFIDEVLVGDLDEWPRTWRKPRERSKFLDFIRRIFK